MSSDDLKGILHRMARSRKDRVLGGVCGGLAEVADIPSWIIRAAFLVALVTAGAGVIIYLILWLLMPEASE